MVAFEHFDLEVDFIGYVHKLLGDEVDAGQRVHVVDRHELRGLLRLGRPVGESRRERRVEDELRGRRVVGHVVVGVVRDDDVRLRVLDDLDDLAAALRVVRVDVEVTEDAVKHLDARERACGARLGGAHGHQLLGRNHHMPERARAEVRHDHRVAALHAFRQRSRARDFNIIRMTSDSQYSHLIHLPAIGQLFCSGFLPIEAVAKSGRDGVPPPSAAGDGTPALPERQGFATVSIIIIAKVLTYSTTSPRSAQPYIAVRPATGRICVSHPCVLRLETT